MVERVAQRDVDVFVVFAVRDDLLAGKTNIHAHPKVFAFAMVLAELFHGHAAARNAGMEFLQLRHLLADTRIERVGVRHAADRDLHRDLHGGTFAVVSPGEPARVRKR